MLKTQVVLEEKIGENTHCYNPPAQAGLGECFDALCKFQQYIINKMRETQPVPKEETQSEKPVESQDQPEQQ